VPLTILGQATLAGLLVAQLVLLILRSQKIAAHTSASLAADTLAVLGTSITAWLTCVVHQRSLRSSTLLILYLSAIAILNIPRVRTLWLIQDASGEAATMTTISILTATVLVLESVQKKSSILEEKRFGSPEEYCGLWNRTAFTWLTATFRTGYSKLISQDDLPCLDTRLRSNLLCQELVNTWRTCKYPRWTYLFS
jgi:ATP-binding cassette subfamily C (CFTR/MRP) protein 1